ncbi:hemerythrin domain-containing protein [Ottowia sp.]|uniref:hemerythrin domain-containing protein n=1 Tax=Ottowia sp. TaxID=1898956 RepID=UPI001D54BE49|nr:hemerythrin domain-containing protein [Ottowia sp.]MCP5258994.1 hemerythrin domain-containing protein [Burkholderiaceae bacterium]MCB2025488.1 hemerythrin domain-containing protein [Ottowia sp.]MCB2036788.1 hemerythrin domain-containing protein [Ottowia sp.]HPK33170.1 hemerythrin domain-containing protein [Ottowia sp.]HRW70963.1 hemerythrin domain-containing protein [Ottowia sp.]
MSPKADTPRTARAPEGALFQFLDETHQRLQLELIHLNRVVEAFAEDQMEPHDREQLARTIEWFDTVARQHHLDEEKHVFPPLLASSDAHVVEVTERLRQDHGWIEQNWLELGPHLSAVVNGNHWIEPELVQQMVQVFSQLCLDHLMLEESLAYPEARAQIDADALTKADQEMEQRRASFAARKEARH